MTSKTWGGGGFSQAMEDAVQRANDNDVLFMLLSGNDGLDNDLFPVWPANLTLIMLYQ